VLTEQVSGLFGTTQFLFDLIARTVSMNKAWHPLSKSDKPSAVSRKQLESAITKVVKSVLDCEAFVGVIIQRIEPKSSTDPNWAVRGVRFGKADRDKSGKVLATVVERMQREFSLTDDQDDAAQTKGLKQ
jgi:hypothetical protein